MSSLWGHDLELGGCPFPLLEPSAGWKFLVYPQVLHHKTEVTNLWHILDALQKHRSPFPDIVAHKSPFPHYFICFLWGFLFPKVAFGCAHISLQPSGIPGLPPKAEERCRGWLNPQQGRGISQDLVWVQEGCKAQLPTQPARTKLRAQNLLLLSPLHLPELWPAAASPATERSTHQSPGDITSGCSGTSQFWQDGFVLISLIITLAFIH